MSAPQPDQSSPAPAPTKDDIPAILADTAVVFLFALIGRASHDEGLGVQEVFYTGLPFWAGALIGHVIVKFIRRDPRSLIWGGFILVSAWVLGHLGRLMLQEGSDPAFLAVSAAFLALGLLGWRAATLFWTRRTRSRP